MTMVAKIGPGVAIGTDAAVNLLSESRVDGVDQIADVVLDIRVLHVLSPEISGIDNRKQVLEDVNDRGLIRKRSSGQMLQFRLQTAEALQNFARDFADLVSFFQMLIHGLCLPPAAA